MVEGYSLMKLRNRFAVEGEELVVHRFRSGLVGVVSCGDFDRWLSRTLPSAESVAATPQRPPGIWTAIRNFCADFLTYYGFIDFDELRTDEPGPVVAIRPDALLRVFDISPAWQEQYHLASSEDALFIELSPPLSRSALCFGNGTVIPLKLLKEGQRVKVLRRSWAESLEPAPELIQVRS